MAVASIFYYPIPQTTEIQFLLLLGPDDDYTGRVLVSFPVCVVPSSLAWNVGFFFNKTALDVKPASNQTSPFVLTSLETGPGGL